MELFLAERQEFYEKPGFYQIASAETVNSFLDSLKDSAIPKRFETGKILGQKWSERLGRLARDNFSIDDIQENSLKNLILANKDYFYSGQLDEMILIPEHLRGFPFVWDSVNHLKLVSISFDPVSIENIEVYLAAEWINCYLTNYGALIPNGLIGVGDCTLGIESNIDVLFILRFLSHYKLLDLIAALSFEELIALKLSFALYLREILNASFNGRLHLSSPAKVERKVEKIRASRCSCYLKIKKIVIYLYEERK